MLYQRSGISLSSSTIFFDISSSSPLIFRERSLAISGYAGASA